MADQDLKSRVEALERRIATIGGGSAFRPISPLTARNPMFVRGKSIDHHQMKDRTRSFFVPVFSSTVRTGSPAVAVSGSNTRYRAWAFDAASTEEILCEGFLPTDFQYSGPQVTIVLWHTNLGAGSGNVAWQVTAIPVNDTAIVGVNGDLNATSGETTISEAIAAPIQDSLKISVLGTTVSPTRVAQSRSLVRLGIARIGGDGGDTLANDAGLVGVELRYTADM